jgi:hypothetical protein
MSIFNKQKTNTMRYLDANSESLVNLNKVIESLNISIDLVKSINPIVVLKNEWVNGIQQMYLVDNNALNIAL